MKVTQTTTAQGKAFLQSLKYLQGYVGRAGWFENQVYDNARRTPVARVAAIQEFGWPAKNIPPRPFMRPTIQEKQTEWQEIAYSGAKAVLNGKGNIGAVMGAIAAHAAGSIRKKIAQILSPPLKPATIARRLAKYKNKKKVGSLTKPLIDTTQMYESVTHAVEREK